MLDEAGDQASRKVVIVVMASELMIGLWRKMVLQTKVLSAPTPLEMMFTFTYKYCKIYVRVGD